MSEQISDSSRLGSDKLSELGGGGPKGLIPQPGATLLSISDPFEPDLQQTDPVGNRQESHLKPPKGNVISETTTSENPSTTAALSAQLDGRSTSHSVNIPSDTQQSRNPKDRVETAMFAPGKTSTSARAIGKSATIASQHQPSSFSRVLLTSSHTSSEVVPLSEVMSVSAAPFNSILAPGSEQKTISHQLSPKTTSKAPKTAEPTTDASTKNLRAGSQLPGIVTSSETPQVVSSDAIQMVTSVSKDIQAPRILRPAEASPAFSVPPSRSPSKSAADNTSVTPMVAEPWSDSATGLGSISLINQIPSKVDTGLALPQASAETVSSHLVSPPMTTPPHVDVFKDTTLEAKLAPSLTGNLFGISDKTSTNVNSRQAPVDAAFGSSPGFLRSQETKESMHTDKGSSVASSQMKTMSSMITSHATIQRLAHFEGASATRFSDRSSSSTPADLVHFTRARASEFAIGSQTVIVNDDGVEVAGHTFDLGHPTNPMGTTHSSSGRVEVIGQETEGLDKVHHSTIPALPAALIPNLSEIGGSTIARGSEPLAKWDLHGETIVVKANAMVVAGKTIGPGKSAATVDGANVSLGASRLIIGSQTITYYNSESPLATQAPMINVLEELGASAVHKSATESVLAIGHEALTIHPSALALASHILVPGGPGITLFGTLVSLGVSQLVIGSQTATFGMGHSTSGAVEAFVTALKELGATEAPASAINPVVAIGHEIVTINPSNVALAGHTLKPGSAGMTISGTFISLGSSQLIIGTRTEDYAIPHTSMANAAILSELYHAGASLVSVKTEMQFAVGGETFTAGSSYVAVAGHTLVPGGADVTISGDRVSVGTSDVVVGCTTEIPTAFWDPKTTTTGENPAATTTEMNKSEMSAGPTSLSTASSSHRSNGLRLLPPNFYLTMTVLLFGLAVQGVWR